MADDPIAGITGGVVGLGVATKLLGKAPIVGPELKKLADTFKGAPPPADFNDQPYGRTVGTEGGGNPLRESSIDATSADVGGGAAAAGGAEAGGAGLADVAALAAL